MTGRDEWTKDWTMAEARGGYYFKKINDKRFVIDRFGKTWYLSFFSETIATRPTLRECQILAHKTDRLWTGETE